MIGRWLCRRGRHDWRIEQWGQLVDGRSFRRIGEHVPCRRGCGVDAVATKDGWRTVRVVE